MPDLDQWKISVFVIATISLGLPIHKDMFGDKPCTAFLPTEGSWACTHVPQHPVYFLATKTKTPYMSGRGDKAAGTVEKNYTVHLECDTPGSQIFYTLDGSSPDVSRIVPKVSTHWSLCQDPCCVCWVWCMLSMVYVEYEKCYTWRVPCTCKGLFDVKKLCTYVYILSDCDTFFQLYKPDKGVCLRQSGLCVLRAMATSNDALNSDVMTSKRFWVLQGDEDNMSTSSGEPEQVAPSNNVSDSRITWSLFSHQISRSIKLRCIPIRNRGPALTICCFSSLIWDTWQF